MVASARSCGRRSSLQTLALTLTFTRASLGLAIVALAVLLLLRGRVRYMVPVLLVVAARVRHDAERRAATRLRAVHARATGRRRAPDQ